MNTDEQYIILYDKLGSKYFGKGDDEQLREWGNSEERIREIKIQSVECHLNFYNRGVEAYKLLNEICGGKNIAM